MSVGGHSIGGAAALQTGRTDKRIQNAIDLDGDVWGDVEKSGTRKPFLVLLNRPGSEVKIPKKMGDERLDEWRGVLAKSSVGGTVLTLGPAYHFTFSDIPFLLPPDILKASGATLVPMQGRNAIANAMEAWIKDGQIRRSLGLQFLMSNSAPKPNRGKLTSR